jgi:hypothetical protein
VDGVGADQNGNLKGPNGNAPLELFPKLVEITYFCYRIFGNLQWNRFDKKFSPASTL